VRVRVTRVCKDEVDGVPLAGFEPGLVYDVSASLGSYLIATGCAVAVLDDEVEERQEEEQQFRVNMRRWREVAADISRRRRR
jgi:hypothetical protein